MSSRDVGRRAPHLDGDDLRRPRQHRRRQRRRCSPTSVDRFDITALARAGRPARVHADRDDRRREGRDQGDPAARRSRRSPRSPASTRRRCSPPSPSDPESNFTYLAKAVKLDVFNQVKALQHPVGLQRAAPVAHATRTARSPATSSASSAPTARRPASSARRTRASTRPTARRATRCSADGVRLPGSDDRRGAADGRRDDPADDRLRPQLVRAAGARRAGHRPRRGLGDRDGRAGERRADHGRRGLADRRPQRPRRAPTRARWEHACSARPYEPGSIMKPATIASLLDAGKITPTTADHGARAVHRRTSGGPLHQGLLGALRPAVHRDRRPR